MSYDWQRRAFIAVLSVVLALLVLKLGTHAVNDQAAFERRYPRKNYTVKLERAEDGVIRVDGEGKLYGADMLALIKGAGIHANETTDIIIGDGITEIGNGALADRDYLKTLWLGRNVKKICVGGFRNCKRLKYVFIPSGLESVSKDCLYASKCTIITDGSASDLPEMYGKHEEVQIIEHVDSWEALVAACGDEPPPEVLKQWWQ